MKKRLVESRATRSRVLGVVNRRLIQAWSASRTRVRAMAAGMGPYPGRWAGSLLRANKVSGVITSWISTLTRGLPSLPVSVLVRAPAGAAVGVVVGVSLGALLPAIVPVAVAPVVSVRWLVPGRVLVPGHVLVPDMALVLALIKMCAFS